MSWLRGLRWAFRRNTESRAAGRPSAETASQPEVPVRHDDVHRAAAYWDRRAREGDGGVRYWLAVPEVRRAVNRLLTGDPDLLYITRFLRQFEESPVRRALSAGCGTGEVERGMVGMGVVEHVVGIDVSPASIEEAERLAAERGFADRITYRVTEAAPFLEDATEGSYDLVVFHGSLHHLREPEAILAETARALTGGTPGLVYIDEYVGPSRDEWTDEHLRLARELFAEVPSECRRTETVWPPIAIDDPSEMIHSSRIPGAFRASFETVDYRPYYGNVLAPLVSAIRADCLVEARVVQAIARALKLEKELAISRAEPPLYTIFLGHPRSRPTPRA